MNASNRRSTSTCAAASSVSIAGAVGRLPGLEASAYVTGQILLVDGGISTGALRAMPRPT
jgi:hypothetical protein